MIFYPEENLKMIFALINHFSLRALRSTIINFCATNGDIITQETKEFERHLQLWGAKQKKPTQKNHNLKEAKSIMPVYKV